LTYGLCPCFRETNGVASTIAGRIFFGNKSFFVQDPYGITYGGLGYVEFLGQVAYIAEFGFVVSNEN